jgi:TRAP-type transport system periplasmic protein
MMKRMNASPVAMSLGDVLQAVQQGAIDGALGTIAVFGPLHYVDTTKYMMNNGQPYVNVIVVMNKKWVEALPPDLQKIVRDDATSVNKEIVALAREAYAIERKEWTDKGGELINPPEDEEAAVNAKIATIGDELSKDRPELNKAVKVVAEAAARNK